MAINCKGFGAGSEEGMSMTDNVLDNLSVSG
jgi:hypothetical protein